MKKFIVSLFCILILTSCTQKKQDDVKYKDIATEYIELLKNYQTREKSTANADNPDFDAFLDKVFVEAMESDYIGMHYNVIDYKKYGIEKPPVDLGEIKYGFDEENYTYMLDQLKELQGFDYNSLSYRQQYDYEALEYSLYETLALYGYYQYNFLFSSGSCLPENIISNFTDFTFYDEESIEDYLTCLKDVTLFTGTHEFLYPDIVKFSRILKRKKIKNTLIIGEGLNHVYPAYPIPEADEAIKQISKIINKKW